MRDIARLRGFRASLAVSLAIEGQPIGFVNVTRREPGAFRPEDVELLKTFADQAVIAIQNARLFTELSDALEQQTATAEILRVISQSPTDVSPVLAAVAKAALKFCGAGDALVSLRDADNWFIAAHEGPIEATPGLRRLTRGTAPGRAMVDGTVAHVADLQSPEADDYPEAREFGAREGFRAALAAPLLRDDVPIGAISLRRPEPGPFTPNQVDLLKSFAAQAVIAIENVRLFTELRESLDQQTAMADILRVISQSPTDVQPVFAAVAESSVRLCGADRAFIFRFDGELLRMVASHNCDPEFVKWVAQHPIPPGRHSGSGRAALERRTIHVPDVLADPEYSYGAKDVEAIRTILGVPILKGEDLLGVMMIFHLEVRPFTDKQIALVETFADQAAIAIENVRLFTELRDSLERLKAAQANLVHSEKMASLGQLTAGIAHEIKNPLNFVNNFASLSVELLDELKETADAAFATLDADTQAEIDETMELLTANLGKIAEHGKRADGIVRSMLSHSRGGSGDWTPSDINALVEEALNLAYHGARAQDNEFNVTLERDFAPTPAPIEVVPQDVTRVFLNMFGNGFYAVGKRRKVGKQAEPGFRPTLKVTTRDLGEAVEVRVRDNGTGIPPDVREKLFQPFFTTKPTGEGTGLGLSISYDIVTQQHGGTIEVESEPGSFTEFTVRLPRRRVQPSERA
jgi:signal transduction histidine kinase